MTILVTGGTGTFGQAFTRRLLADGHTVRVFSRDEFKQGVMRDELGVDSDHVRYLVGCVRDRRRLGRAVQGVDLVVHAAALKQVPSCEYNPDECVKTNVLGSMNVVEACLDAGVPKAILLSSDKAVHPVNVYGASKLCAEKVWLASNALGNSCFAAVRYGNVEGSRGSVLERWGAASGGSVELTDSRATRFWLHIDAAVDLVLMAAGTMVGGELFVPKLESSRVLDRIPAGAEVTEIGLRPGEKLHEVLVSDEETRRCYDMGDHYRICDYWPEGGVRVGEGFRYSSECVAA